MLVPLGGGPPDQRRVRHSVRKHMMKARLLLIALLAASIQFVAAQSTIFLVRHAEKTAGEGTNANDPDLSQAGRERAEALALMLKDAGLTAIYATEFKRTQQTAAPVARSVGIEVTIIAAKEIDTLVARLTKTENNALVVGHSNTIPEVLKALGLADAVTLHETEYDNLFVVTRASPPQLFRLHYQSCPR